MLEHVAGVALTTQARLPAGIGDVFDNVDTKAMLVGFPDSSVDFPGPMAVFQLTNGRVDRPVNYLFSLRQYSAEERELREACYRLCERKRTPRQQPQIASPELIS